MLQDGQIARQVIVWDDGMASWTPLAEVGHALGIATAATHGHGHPEDAEPMRSPQPGAAAAPHDDHLSFMEQYKLSQQPQPQQQQAGQPVLQGSTVTYTASSSTKATGVDALTNPIEIESVELAEPQTAKKPADAGLLRAPPPLTTELQEKVAQLAASSRDSLFSRKWR